MTVLEYLKRAQMRAKAYSTNPELTKEDRKWWASIEKDIRTTIKNSLDSKPQNHKG